MKDVKLAITSILIISIVTLALSACIQKQKPTADEIIGKMQQKYDSIESYKAEIHQIESNGKTKESDYTVYFKKPDKFRADYPLKGIVTVWTNKLIWSYTESKNEVRLRKINASLSEPIDLIGFILKEVEKYYVTLAGEERISGKECYMLDLKPTKEEPAQIQKLWITKDEWYPTKIQFRIKPPEDFQKIFPNITLPAEATSILEIRKIEFKEVSDELFVPPENAIIIEEGLRLLKMNHSTVMDVLAREEVKLEIGEEYEINQYFVKDSTLNILVLTPCADYMVKYNLKNGAVLIDKVNPWKKTIKEEPVTEEERQKFLAVVLNDSRVKEALKGRSFNVSMVKYVMYAACQKAVDPDSVHMMFKVDSELYRVILSGLGGKLEVVRVEKIV
jgi:outer membrane lipoprotein-sorting protein